MSKKGALVQQTEQRLSIALAFFPNSLHFPLSIRVAFDKKCHNCGEIIKSALGRECGFSDYEKPFSDTCIYRACDKKSCTTSLLEHIFREHTTGQMGYLDFPDHLEHWDFCNKCEGTFNELELTEVDKKLYCRDCYDST